MTTHSVFIPSDRAGSRKDTATLLVGTAREFGIGQHDIKTAPTGFRITERLAKVLYDEQDNSTSGNRAEKKDTSHQKGNPA